MLTAATPQSGVLRIEAGTAAAGAGYHFSVVEKGVLLVRPSAVRRIETGGGGRVAVVARLSEVPRTELAVEEVLRPGAPKIGVAEVAGAGPVGGEEVALLSAGRTIGEGGILVGLEGRETGRWTGVMIIMCYFVADVFLPTCGPESSLFSFMHTRTHARHSVFFFFLYFIVCTVGCSMSLTYVFCSDFLSVSSS